MSIFIKTIDFLIFLGLLVLVGSSFMAESHLALYNIAMALSGSGILLKYFITKEHGKSFSKYSLICFFALFSVLVLGTLISDENLSISSKYITDKSKWILIPLIFYLSKLNQKKINYLFITLVFTAFFISIYVIINYLFNDNSTTFHVGMDAGKIPASFFPFKMLHHFFSIVISTTAILLLIYTINNFNSKSTLIWVFVFIILIFIISINLSGARVGMLSFYIGCLFISLIYLKNSKKNLILISITPIIAFTILMIFYHYNHNFRGRIDNTLYEIKYISKTNIAEIEDVGNFTVRIVSYKTVFPLIQENFYRGIGVYHYHENLKKYFNKFTNISLAQSALPPNQWIRYAISFGVPLTIMFFIFLFLPIFLNKKKNIIPLIALYTPIFLLCMTETPLDPRGSYFFSVTIVPLNLILVEFISTNWSLKIKNENIL